MSPVEHRAKGVAIMAIPSDVRTRVEFRRRLAAAVESMIAVLDVLDPDLDLEEEPDVEDDGSAEPWLGWINPMAERMDALRNVPLIPFWGSPYDDRELDEADGRLVDAGDEPEDDPAPEMRT